MASHQVDWQEAYPRQCRGGAGAIGNFDGAHKGHAALVAELLRAARSLGGPAVAMTFDPHPMALLRPEQAPILLTTPEDRAAYLGEMGVDEVLNVRATLDMLDLRAEAFFAQVLVERLGIRALVEGTNFRFGHNREGDIDLLGRLCAAGGVSLRIVAPVLVDGREVSSTRIRLALAAGDVSEAAHLLGRSYRLRGVVGSGQRRGRTIGFPTANLTRVRTVVPATGVYAGVVHLEGQRWPAAVNIGSNPTFQEEEQKIEVHLIGYEGDLYGRELAIEFLERLRDTRPFAGVDELAEQLRRDVEEARRVAEVQS